MSESPTEHFEHAEHAEHAAESGQPFLLTVSVTIALLAVIAASVGSLESVETAATIGRKNEAVLFQSKASDQWAFFQAKSVKKNMYQIAAITSPDKADTFAKDVKKNDDESQAIQKEATELEQKSEERLRESDVHENRHHILTIAVTLLHVSIAVATISIITKGQRWPWYGAILLGLVGVVTTAWAYV